MEREGKAPEDFGLKVRTHPATLEITARNKLGSSSPVIVSVDLVGVVLETSVVHVDPAAEAGENRSAAASLVQTMRSRGIRWEPIGRTTGRFHTGVALDIVRRFLERWQNHTASGLTQIGPVLDHIDTRPVELENWDVAIVGTMRATDSFVWNGFGFELSCQERNAKGLTAGEWAAQSRRFSSRGITRLGMHRDHVRIAEEAFRLNNPGITNVPDKAYCLHRERPLLAVHALVPRGCDPDSGFPPISAWTIAFPSSSVKGATVAYRANTIWRDEYDGIDEDERDYEAA